MKISKMWFATLLLVVFMAGCADGLGQGGGGGAGAPTVSATVPIISATGVCTNKQLTATFSEAMAPATIISPATNVTVKETVSGTNVPGTVTIDSTNTIATFSPTSLLTAGTQYTATITTGVTDLGGTPLASNKEWTFTAGSGTCAAKPVLGIVDPFAIASAAGISNTGATTVNGDVVLEPTATCNGVPSPGCGGTAPIINGTLVFSSATATNVMTALQAVYNTITPAGLPGATVLGCGIIGSGGGGGAGVGCAGNFTLPPGAYIAAIASIGVTGDLILDAQGDQNAVFVFQTNSSTVTTAPGAPGVPGSRILLINGAQASNVFWQVGSSATIGTYSEFRGNILADTSITMNTGATSCGRLLAGAITTSGAFTFDTNTVSVPGTVPSCP